MSQITTTDIAIANGMSFRVSTSGSSGSPPVLWLHGSGPGVTALTNWQEILEDTAGEFFNVAPDIIGFGDSTHPDPPPEGMKPFTELRIHTLAALLDELEVPQVDLVGNSMGGIISMCFALAYPQRVRRIVLMGAGGAPILPTPELMSLITFYDNPTVGAMAELMQKFIVDQAFFAGKLNEIAAERMPRATRPEVERSHRATFTLGDPLPINPESLATVQQPVLILHGDQDRLIPLAAGEWYDEHLPNSRLHVVKDGGHWAQIEHKDEFVREIREFLLG